jgi:glycine/D-amino acid oxidase-like deaminating enzyme
MLSRIATTLPFNFSPSTTSWWFADALSREPAAHQAVPLVGESHCDVAIVGGGYTGLWSAISLKERSPSTSVTLLEANLCGSRASGKNGGVVEGYWASLPSMERNLGADAALEITRAGARAQDAIRTFATSKGREVWWRESGNIRISAAPAQDAAIHVFVETARKLGVADTAQEMSPAQAAAHCNSATFRGGVFFPEGANIHPGLMVRELRRAAISAGVKVFENTPMLRIEKGSPIRLTTVNGQVFARDVILATNGDLASLPQAKPHLSIFSSYALMTAPAHEQIERLNWSQHEGLSDFRMFLHYFRKTIDNRVLMGSGSGPISSNGNTADFRLTKDVASVLRTVKGLRRLLPPFADVGIVSTWGGEIDVSADRLPIVRSIPGTRIHYACGFSGHGVNPTYIAGQILASLALGLNNEWTNLPLRTRVVPHLPPEPFRTYGARIVRWAILGCEEADEKGIEPGVLKRGIAALPKRLGVRVGVR